MNFKSIEELQIYQAELLPLLLDVFEVHKLSCKHCESMKADVEDLLTALYIQLNPDSINRVFFLNMKLIKQLLLC